MDATIEEAAAELLENCNVLALVHAAQKLAIQESISAIGALRNLQSELTNFIAAEFTKAEEVLRQE